MNCKGLSYYDYMLELLQGQGVCCERYPNFYQFAVKILKETRTHISEKNFSHEKQRENEILSCSIPLHPSINSDILVNWYIFCSASDSFEWCSAGSPPLSKNSHTVQTGRHTKFSQQWTLCATNRIDHSDTSIILDHWAISWALLSGVSNGVQVAPLAHNM